MYMSSFPTSKTTPEQFELKSPPEPPRINPAVQPPGIDCPAVIVVQVHVTFPHFQDNSRAGIAEVPTGASQDKSRCTTPRNQPFCYGTL